MAEPDVGKEFCVLAVLTVIVTTKVVPDDKTRRTGTGLVGL